MSRNISPDERAFRVAFGALVFVTALALGALLSMDVPQRTPWPAYSREP